MESNILPDFQKFLLSRGFASSKNAPFYANWVSKFTSLPILSIIVFLLITACAPQRRVVYERTPSPPPEKREVKKLESREPQYGVASWYGADFHGNTLRVAKFTICTN